MEESTQITVFLLDDHEVIRRGVHEMLSAEPDIEVIGETDNAADALRRIPDARPDVAVLDVRLPDGSGIEVCRELRSRNPEIGCLILTSFSDEEALVHAVLAGASGYVLKGIRGAELQSAVRETAAGKVLIGPDAARRVVERLRRGAGAGGPDGGGAARTAGAAGGGSGEASAEQRLAALTGQERIILDLIGAGMTNRAIGEELNLAEKTIKNYVSQLLSKLGMERRTQAAAYVARMQAAGRDDGQKGQKGPGTQGT
ncbi:response regulator [Streptomyces nanshensis]|uniref:LuxR family transcriptional regulator n=1 Tax=Streptomyces nanshensis TaxID=518642 RepID=A0A1E7LD77_9ACTN|nr:response regulator transcription factor [Streptomyces nanshensis]OEV14169.1 LuxR family transcriptional regulator [Streptomyces nanshensis]